MVHAAHRVNAGYVPNLSRPEGGSDFCFAAADEPETAGELLVRIVTERIPNRFGLDPIREVQVLTPMNRGVLGARNLNQVLQARLNPPSEDKAEIERFGYTYRTGDKVLQIENDYGKRLVVLVGMPKAVAIAVKRAESGQRFTALRGRLCDTA
jgi:exodeoxyribonuclease V alpha subunit